MGYAAQKRLTGLIMRQLMENIKRLTGGGLPDDYMAVDIEATGTDPRKDLILEWGHCLVRNREPVERNGTLLNWYMLPDAVPPAWLDKRLAILQRVMSLDGRRWHITPERLKKEGEHPHEVLKAIHSLLNEADKQNLTIISHCGLNFDLKMLLMHFEKDLQLPSPFNGRPRFIDTGALEKASQLPPDVALPRRDETLDRYMSRILAHKAQGVYYNLDKHCLEKYGFAEKHGFSLSDMHSAVQDAYVVHLLFEEYRRLGEAEHVRETIAKRNIPVPVDSSPDSLPEVKSGAEAIFPPAGARRFRGQRNR